jgi:hypothetical protein
MFGQPSRFRKLFAGDRVGELLAEFYPDNTVEVNGESFYKNHLSGIARSLELTSDKFHQVEAYILSERENAHDPNAVAVYIFGDKVGYVNKVEAPLFAKVLSENGGGVWVLAALKHVTDIDQYRVRLMVEKTDMQIDMRAFPLLDLSYLEPKRVKRDSDLAAKLSDLAWRTEFLQPGESLSFAGPSTAYLVLVSDENNKSKIRVICLGLIIAEYTADEEPDLFDAILEVNQCAWASLSFFDDGKTDSFEMFFSKGEGFPKIETFHPGAIWAQER